MRSSRIVSVFLVGCIIGWCLPVLATVSREPFRQEVFVTVPVETPAAAEIFLAGNLPELGNWAADGFKMKKLNTGRWFGSFLTTHGTLIECKVTQGSWATVEKGANGREIANRSFLVEKGMPIEITVKKWFTGETIAGPTWTGTIKTHPQFPSRILTNKRDVWVYLPPDYDKGTAKRYPVIYFHDGQNVFNAASSFQGIEWGADETAQRLIKAGKMQPLIIVAVANTPARMDEYTPVRSPSYPTSGQGKFYGRFLVEELKPFIDKTYRTLSDKKNTAIAGSSLGGLISLYFAAEFPKVFGRCAAISPSIWWENRWILTYLEKHSALLKNTFFWIDAGTREGSSTEGMLENLGNIRDLRKLLIRCGLKPGVGLGYMEAESALHNESAWAARLKDVLPFLFPTPPKKKL